MDRQFFIVQGLLKQGNPHIPFSEEGSTLGSVISDSPVVVFEGSVVGESFTGSVALVLNVSRKTRRLLSSISFGQGSESDRIP